MSIKFNGSNLSKITYNGTDLTVLKYNNTPVWGKPFTLSISAGSNSTVTVTRTSSPNEHASTGVLANAATIYYGDVLTVSFSASSGYKISTSTVNGSACTNGATVTVTNNTNIVTTAVLDKSWHTVWSGTKTITTYNGSTEFSGIIANAEKTRISGTATISVYIENQDTWEIDSHTTTAQIIEQELNSGICVTYEGEPIIYQGQSNTYVPSQYPIYIAFQSVGTNILNCKAITDYEGFPYSTAMYHAVNFMTRGIKVTKIEQYY